jgi:hypothetical protein
VKVFIKKSVFFVSTATAHVGAAVGVSVFERRTAG